jgi:hypothetical protein
MKHPSLVQLALSAGGELGRLERWLVSRHVRKCVECQAELEAFRLSSADLHDLADETPKDLNVNWNRLAEEMTGNIRVGLAAGEAIAAFDPPAARAPRLRWNAATVLAVATVVFAVAFWVSLPQPQAAHLLQSLNRIRTERIGKLVPGHAAPASDEVMLQASSSSIEVKDHDRAMSLIHPASSDAVTISISLQGSAGVRYVDADTGQVTTNKVYYGEP